MKFRLKIADTIEFPVTIAVRDGAVIKEHKFHIIADRLNAEQIDALERPGSEEGKQQIREVLHQRFRGWRDQKLVFGEDDQPAEFGPDALDAILSIPLAAAVLYSEYMQEMFATNGNEGRRKN
jgi:hypothetical protein